MTLMPGRNMRLAGLGVVLVCMNIPRCCWCCIPADRSACFSTMDHKSFVCDTNQHKPYHYTMPQVLSLMG